MVELTFDVVSKIIRADFSTGKLYWLERPAEMFNSADDAKAWNNRFSGKEAFATLDAVGYFRGKIFGRRLFAHRVIMLLATGEWPPEQIDHINGVRHDNRLVNLRNASQLENGKNQRLPSHNTTGVVGVSWRVRENKWHSRICVQQEHINLGLYDSFEEAVKVRKEAEALYGFHENHGEPAIRSLQSEER